MAKKPILTLWSVKHGGHKAFEVSVENNEIVARYEDETIKFPGGITKDELLALQEAHNTANSGVKALTDEDIQAEKDLAEANEKLLNDLSQ